jgi:gas vesicle protein
MSDRNDFASFFSGLIVGGLVGAAVALLMAPQSGEETRTMIHDRGIELRDRAVVYGQDVQARAEAALEDARLRYDAAVVDLRARTEDLAKIVSRPSTAAVPPSETPAE